MNKFHRLGFLLLWVPCAFCAEDLEAGLAKLADNLAAGISKTSMKKVSVLDFTDLQGNNSELGRYVAEQLSISLVNSSKGFSVMNRANLKTILDEHKLTASGLVNPENAQKLGHIAGVDAIVMGTMTPFGETLNLTAQILSTETAQVLGGATTKVTRSKEINELLESATPSKASKPLGDASGGKSGETKDFDVPNGTTVFDDLSIELFSFRFVDGNILLALKLLNRNKVNPLRIGFNSYSRKARTSLIDEHGSDFRMSKATGITVPETAYAETYYQHYFRLLQGERTAQSAVKELAKMYELGVGQTSIVTMTFASAGKTVGMVFRLHSEVMVAEFPKNSIPRFKLHNVLLDGIRPKQ